MKKRGFTLIELMIVLAVIAILAVVIIPKSSIFKKNAKTAGVTTNMNTVRAYLETKTADNGLTDVQLLKAMDKNFTGDEVIKNPVGNDYTNIVDDTDKKADGTTESTKKSIIITDTKPSSADELDKGIVIIYVGKLDVSGAKQGYIVYGVDLDGNLLGNSYTIQK